MIPKKILVVSMIVFLKDPLPRSFRPNVGPGGEVTVLFLFWFLVILPNPPDP